MITMSEKVFKRILYALEHQTILGLDSMCPVCRHCRTSNNRVVHDYRNMAWCSDCHGGDRFEWSKSIKFGNRRAE